MRLASVIFPITLIAIPAFGQTAKVYKWQHPWFKKEITSPIPPTWPYRVIEEKNGIVRVEVTPPVPPTVTQNAPDKAASRATVEEPSVLEWPFTVQTGELNCKWLGDLRLVTLTANGVTYAINPPARARIKEFRWQDGDDIWKRDPKNPESRVSSDIVDRGLSLCRRQPAVSTQPAPAPESSAESTTSTLSSLFDIVKHCKHIGSLATGGSYTLERACRKQEHEALEKLSAIDIPQEIEKHCIHIGGLSHGGSYSLMLTCVRREIEAKESLR